MNAFLDLLRVLGLASVMLAFCLACYWAFTRFSQYEERREAAQNQILRNLAAPTWVTPMPRSEADVRRIVREELNNLQQEK